MTLNSFFFLGGGGASAERPFSFELKTLGEKVGYCQNLPSDFLLFGFIWEKFHQLLAVGRWFPPGTPVSSTRKLISSSSFHRLDMTLAAAEALNPNKLNHCRD